MAQAAISTQGETQEEVPAAARPAAAGSLTAIDRAHLSRMTFGEATLERELLTLFDRQAMLLLARMRDGDAAVVATLAHTLKGSASGIGAWGVARAAAACEQAAGSAGSPVARGLALDELAAAIAEVRVEIARLLAASAA